VRIYGDGSLPITLLEESQPDMPFDETKINLLELSWDPKAEQVSSRRKRADLPAVYSVVNQVKVKPLQTS
jgi:hypothetical protein